MIERLERFPHEPVQIVDDYDAATFLLELGLAGKFLTGADAPSDTQALTYADHPTHFIFVVLFHAKTNPEDNGYVIFCLPKSLLTGEQASDFVEKRMIELGTPLYSKPFSTDAVVN